jgi:hypothetical protein
MMKDNIFSICLGNNSSNLSGCKNDSIIFYDYLTSLHKNKNLKENWLKPNILINENVAVDNIIKLISDSSNVINKLLIFYSGHGFYPNQLNIFNNSSKKLTSTELIKEINKELKNNIKLYIILDSCYSGSFQIVPYKKIKEVKLIASTESLGKSTESIIDVKNIKLKSNKLFNNKNKIKFGTFTFHFLNLLSKLNVTKIDDFKKPFYSDDYNYIWLIIGIIGRQYPKIIW